MADVLEIYSSNTVIEAGSAPLEVLEVGSLLGGQGPQGPPGPTGPQGIQGVPGTPGAAGAQGPQGVQGPAGAQGETGPQGLQGIQGLQGPKGDPGAAGATGPKGDPGDAGAPGVGVPAGGSTGQVLTKVSSSSYDTTWTTPTGGGGPAELPPGSSDGQVLTWDADLQEWKPGEPGQGPEGPEGPQGPAGADGAPGVDGAPGAPGANGADGGDGADGASAYELAVGEGFVGSISAWLESLVGPQGEQGEQGPAGADGAPGAAGAQGLKGDTGAKGEKGDRGDEGPQGPQGPKGDKGDPGEGGGGGGGPAGLFPLIGYGLTFASGDPDNFMAVNSFGSSILMLTRVWIPAGTPINTLWAAVRTGGTYSSSAVPNTIGVYTDAGVYVTALASDTTLWTAAGWRGGALPSPVAAQGAGRFVYIAILGGGVASFSLQATTAAADPSVNWYGVPVPGTSPQNRRSVYQFSVTSLPASFSPASYGTLTAYTPLVGGN